MDQDRFESEMLPSLVNKIIGNYDSPRCMVFTDVKSRLKRIFNLNNSCYVTEKFLEEVPIQRKYSICVIIFY